MIDGELIGGDGDRLDLWSLKRVLGAGQADCISIVAFDLRANGADLRQRPLDARKDRLGSRWPRTSRMASVCWQRRRDWVLKVWFRSGALGCNALVGRDSG